jgi:citrate lyase subunit beta/citryl-CoA lyase
VARRRSFLYVPGGEERKVRKAPSIGADVVVLDLEDAVPPGMKEEARRLLSTLLEELEWKGELCVRVNPLWSGEGMRDLEHVARWDPVSCVVVPKAEPGLPGLAYRATGRSVVPLVETPRGVVRLEDVVREEGVAAVTWGPADLALSVGGRLEAYSGSACVRTWVALAAHAYGVDPIDSVYFKVDDVEGYRREALEAKALGYVGKSAIHPRQVEVANEVFTPTREEVEWARRVVEVYESAAARGAGALKVEGELVDAVHYRIARRILEAAGPEAR